MTTLPKINSKEFESWLMQFLGYDLDLESEMIFIDLFQEGSRFANAETLWERVEEYIDIYPRRKKKVASMTDALLSFLLEKGVLNNRECTFVRKKLSEVLKTK